MEMNTIKESLGLPAEARDEEVLAKIQEMRSALGEDFTKENPSLTLIRTGQHEQVGPAADGGLVLTLAYPIKKGNLVFNEMTFRRARFKDIRRAAAKSGEVDQMAEMISAMTGQAMGVLDELDNSDFALCQQVVAFLGQRHPRTGQSS